MARPLTRPAAMPPRYFATSENPAGNWQGRRTPLASTDPDAMERRLLGERTGNDQVDALRCQGLRETLVGLFNCPEIHWSEKREALAHLDTIRDNLRKLAAWERNVREEVERRRLREQQRKQGLRGVLAREVPAACPACGSTPGYNAETCGPCYEVTLAQHQAA